MGLEVNPEKIKNKLLSLHQNAGHNHNVKVAERSSVNAYLGISVTNTYLVQEKMKRRLNSGNACYSSVQDLLSSHLLSKSIKNGIHKLIKNLPVVLYGCEIWSLI
jgi:hypothetical protein